MEPTPRILGLIAVGLLISLLIGASALWSLAQPADLSIGSKNFTESRLLAEIMAQAIERRTGLRVARRELGSTSLCVDALANGAIDCYPEYSGTLLTHLFKQAAIADPRLAMARVQELLARDRRFAAGPRFGFNDTYALVLRADQADRLGLRRISDLARHPGLVVGFTAEFNQRPDGWPGLARHYGLRLASRPLDLAPGHMYAAVRDGQVQVISAFSTDARIRQFGLAVLEDDRRFFPAYDAVPLLRADLAGRQPAAVAALGSLAGRIDDETMATLNARVDLEGRPLHLVASAFLDGLAAPAASPSR